MRADWRGLAITGGSETTRAAIDDFSEGLLAYEPRVANILRAADEAPDCALANAYASMLHMFMETGSAPLAAQPYLRRARDAAGSATARERLVVAAADAWVTGDIDRAIAAGSTAAREYPRDLALAKITQYHQFNCGDFPGMMGLAAMIVGCNREVGYVHGMLAFGYEQCHRLRETEATASTALAMRPDDAWAQHALAHVLLTEGRHDEGRAFLESRKDGWTRLNSFMHTHNWWHLALVRIAQGDTDAVLADYDAHIWGVWKEYSQDQIGAVSLLARLELAGVDVGDRWDDVADHLACRVDDHVQPFLSMHYLYGLARSGRPEAPAMMRAIRATAAAHPAARVAWSEVAVPACEGLLAYAGGDSQRAADRLGRVLPRLTEIGGSHAQRDLFHRIAMDAARRAA